MKCGNCRILDGELSMQRIRKVARQMKARTALDLIIVDYDELVEAPGDTEFGQQRYIVRSGKSLAIERWLGHLGKRCAFPTFPPLRRRRGLYLDLESGHFTC